MAEKKKKSDTRIAFEKKFKAERKKQGAGGTFTFRGKKYTTDYASDKKSKKKKESGAIKKSSPPLKRPKKLPPGNRTDGDPIKVTILEPADMKGSRTRKERIKDTTTGPQTKPDTKKAEKAPSKTREKNPFRTVEPRPRTRLDNKGKRKEWDKKFGDTHNHDGTPKMSSKGYSMGGMMPMDQQRKVNPTTGLSMNKGGMSDMRKTGMFYGGGMARKR